MVTNAALQLLTALLVVTVSRPQQDSLLPYTYPEETLPNTTTLTFGLMQSFGGTYNGSGSIPGVQLALDNINQAQELLPGYTLRFVLRDSFVSHRERAVTSCLPVLALCIHVYVHLLRVGFCTCDLCG